MYPVSIYCWSMEVMSSKFHVSCIKLLLEYGSNVKCKFYTSIVTKGNGQRKIRHKRSLQPDCANHWYFTLKPFYLTEFKVWFIRGFDIRLQRQRDLGRSSIYIYFLDIISLIYIYQLIMREDQLYTYVSIV